MIKEKLLKYDSDVRKSKTDVKNELVVLNEKTEGLIYYTNHPSEKPIILQLRLEYLIKNKIAKKFNYV